MRPAEGCWESESVEATRAFGRRLGERAFAGMVVCLAGPLGAGKTQLAKGIALGAGVPDPRLVVSPTFTLINEYQGRLPVWHVDGYRVKSAAELVEVGIEEYLYGPGVTLVEWPERIAACLPADRLDIALAHLSPTRRRLTWAARGPRHAALVDEVGHP